MTGNRAIGQSVTGNWQTGAGIGILALVLVSCGAGELQPTQVTRGSDSATVTGLTSVLESEGSPRNNATDVPVDGGIVIKLSAPIQEAPMKNRDNFRVEDRFGVGIDGFRIISNDRKTIVFAPATAGQYQPLQLGHPYKVILRKQIDDAGIPIGDYILQFTTQTSSTATGRFRADTIYPDKEYIRHDQRIRIGFTENIALSPEGGTCSTYAWTNSVEVKAFQLVNGNYETSYTPLAGQICITEGRFLDFIPAGGGNLPPLSLIEVTVKPSPTLMSFARNEPLAGTLTRRFKVYPDTAAIIRALGSIF